jgi:hypothetical protein
MAFSQTSSLDSVTAAVVKGHKQHTENDRLTTSESVLQIQIHK